jgi:hypothetical protein
LIQINNKQTSKTSKSPASQAKHSSPDRLGRLTYLPGGVAICHFIIMMIAGDHFDGGRAFAKLHLAHLTMRVKRTRRWHISITSHGVFNGDVTLALWANAGRGHADAHVQRLPGSEVLQRRSPKDGFEKSRIGRESDNGAAQGYLRSAQQSKDANP